MPRHASDEPHLVVRLPFRIAGTVVLAPTAVLAAAMPFTVARPIVATWLVAVSIAVFAGGAVASFWLPPRPARIALRTTAWFLGALLGANAVSQLNQQVGPSRPAMDAVRPAAAFVCLGLPSFWFAITGRLPRRLVSRLAVPPNPPATSDSGRHPPTTPT